MYELKLSRPPFYRVKCGQTAEDIAAAFGCPVAGEVFCGAIVALPRGKFSVCLASVGDSFASLAAKYGCTEEELIRLNGGGVVYPTRTLFVPCK